MATYSELRQQADCVWQAFATPARPHIALNVSTDSYARHGVGTLAELQRQVQERGLAVDMGVTGSIG